MNVSIKPDGTGVVTLDGDLSIERAAELKVVLEQALVEADPVIIHCQEVSGIDLACLQVLCAAHRSALAAEKKLLLEKEESAIMTEVIRTSGFVRNKCCNDHRHRVCLWKEGDQP